MKKRNLLIIMLIFIAAAVFSSCGEDKESDNTDLGARLSAAGAEEIAAYLLENIEFEDAMQSVDSDIAMSLYNLSEDQIEEAFVVGSTGATAEEIAVFKFYDNQEENIENACGARIEAQRAVFENYVPKEMEKLSNPVIIAEGNTAISVVCNEPEKVIELIERFGE